MPARQAYRTVDVDIRKFRPNRIRGSVETAFYGAYHFSDLITPRSIRPDLLKRYTERPVAY